MTFRLTFVWLKRPVPAALLVVLLWAICRLAVLWYMGIPPPRILDEFSYLLQADIFAHGHLAMPSHPLERFFESPHELFRPVYASKYPPGQAMFLALGQRLFGNPFYGVLIGNALMLFTFCQMLYAWVRPRWALAVSAMFVLILWPGMYWTNSYWGGSVAASGGALVLLSIGMYRVRQTWIAGAIFASGALLLFWTRPYEGGVFALAVLMVFAKEIWANRRIGAIAVALTVLALGGAWTAYDNQVITGSPFHLPYMEHVRQYDTTPAFWFLPMHSEPAYAHPRLAAVSGLHGLDARHYQPGRPRWQLFGIGLIAFLWVVHPALGPGILLMLLVPVAWRDPLFRKMAIVVGVFLLAQSFETWHQEHYTAPVWAAIALMIAIWAERAWNLRFHKRRVGVVLVVLALALPMFLGLGEKEFAGLRGGFEFALVSGESADMPPANWHKQRAALIQRLSALNQRQLVIVRYPSPDWNIDEEWVYNGADIDAQRVVFAHDLGMVQNRALLDYYPDRAALLLTFDSNSNEEKVEPYPGKSGNRGT